MVRIGEEYEAKRIRKVALSSITDYSLADLLYISATEKLRNFIVKTGGTEVPATKSLYDVLNKAWKYQVQAALNQDPPVADTYYTVLDTTADVKLIQILSRQIHDEAGIKAMKLKITIDGQTIESSNRNHNDSTWYYWYLAADNNPNATTSVYNIGGYTPLCGQSVKVEVKQVTAVGTNQQLDGRCHYETFEST